MNIVYRDTASVAGYSSQQKQSSMRHGRISASGCAESVASMPLDDAYLRKKKQSGLFSRRRMSLAAGQEVRRTPPAMSRSADHLHHSFPARKNRRSSMSAVGGGGTNSVRPKPSRGRSEYHETLGGSFSFSSTKLGKMLQRSGFEMGRDFEVKCKSIQHQQHQQRPKSPQSPTRRSSCIASNSFGLGYSNQPTNQGIVVEDHLDTQKVDLRRTHSLEYTKREPISPYMKVRKPLVRKENEVRKLRAPDKDASPNKHSTEAWPLRSHQIHSSLAQMETLLPPCLSGSDCSPSTCSESSMSLGELNHCEVNATKPLPLASTHGALKSVGKETQGPVDKKAVIDKIKAIDARLSCMLTACHETSRKLKMLDDDISLSDSSDDLSDLSLVCEQRFNVT